MIDLETKIETLEEENDKLRTRITEKDEQLSSYTSLVESLKDQLEENDVSTDSIDDCRRSLFFAIEELKEIQQGNYTVDEKIRDLTLRHCRFI